MDFDFDWKVYAALALVFFLMALPILHRRLYGSVPEKNPNDLLDPNNNFKLIDLRSEKDYLMSHIENAINIPCQSVEVCKEQVLKLITQTDNNSPAVLICDTDLVSTRLAKKLLDAGCNEIFILKGGLNYWKRKALPLIKATSS